MLNLKEVLTNSYCEVIRNHLENNMLTGNRKLSAEKQEFEFYKYLEQYEREKEELILKWADTPVEELNGSTPSELISGMENFADVFDLYLYMAEHTDEEVPPVVIKRLKDFSNEAVPALADLANSCLNNGNTDIDFIAAVSALGKIGNKDSIDKLINLAYSMNEKNLDLDYVEEALRHAGSGTIEPILEILDKGEMGKVEKMLLYVLASVGANHKDDRIYRLLRSAFRTMDDKMLAVNCLNEYGDGRAIPMLRGYLERNSKLEKNLYFEIVGTIRNLGGITDDLLKPF